MLLNIRVRIPYLTGLKKLINFMTGLLEAVELEEKLRKPSPTVSDMTVVRQEPISHPRI